MTAWKRLIGLLGTIIVGGILLSLCGGPSLKYLVMPGSMVLVWGMTLGLGLFTFDRKLFFGEFKKIFSLNRPRRDQQSKRMLSQLALYALLSGFLLAVVQILLQGYKTPEGIESIGANPLSLRAPLTILMYAVLTALGLWLIAGQRESNPENTDENETVGAPRHHMAGACLLLGMMTGLVILLVIGMTQDSMQRDNDTQRSGNQSGNVVSNKVEGLYQGEDLLWRSTSMRESKAIVSTMDTVKNVTYRDPGTNLIVTDAATGVEEMPLRWELSLGEGVWGKDLMSPESSQPALP